MAVTNKDFKIKSGLIVEGTNGTINNYNILTESQDSIDFIVDTVGGTATPLNTPDTVVKRDGSGDFAAGTITADLNGNVTGNVTGDVTGTVSDISNHNTDDLTEGTSNKYFTDQRALDATSAAYDAAGSAATAESNAISAAALDATTKANTAESNANSYTDGEITTALSTAQGYANTAESNANSATDTKLQDYTTTANLDTTIDGYGYLKSADLSGYATETYVDTAVSGLVDSAPELLNTLNELAAAIGDDANYATTVSNLIAGKQDNLTAGSNIDITSDVISVTGLDTDDVAEGTNLYFTDARAQSAVAGDISSAINALDTDDIEEGATNLYFTSQRAVTANTGLWDTVGSADAAQAAAETFATNAINALDTDDIEEGTTNVYFTDGRAKDSAAALLTSATLTNITITGTGNGGLTITAENGVADSTTDDLAEGENNLYFTDERAIDAIDAVVIYPEAVIFNNLAKQVAATATVATASENTIYSWAKADYRTAKFLVKTAYGTHTDVAEVLLTLDTLDNIAITEYAMVGTNGSAMTISADISGTDVRLRVTTVNNNSTVTVVGTLLA